MSIPFPDFILFSSVPLLDAGIPFLRSDSFLTLLHPHRTVIVLFPLSLFFALTGLGKSCLGRLLCPLCPIPTLAIMVPNVVKNFQVPFLLLLCASFFTFW